MEYDLNPFEIASLRILVASRLACSYSIGCYAYSLNPENAYLLLHAEPAKKALKLIWDQSLVHSIDKFFETACINKNIVEGTERIDCSDVEVSDNQLPEL